MKQLFPGEVFANTADFDTGIRQLLPRYEEMLGAIARCLPSTKNRILELGCGTGELSLKVLNHCPAAQLVAVDYSPRMLQFAALIRARLGTASTHDPSSQDQLATLPRHLQMVTTAGFDLVAVPWKYYVLAVFGGWVG